MKLKSIRIVNMHNVEDKTYELSSGFTYFRGPNGAGKSTILEAIQLVILGYIPGYAKTNEAIMKHSSSYQMQVIGTFDDGSVVTRTWTRSGSSVSSDIETIPPTLKSNLDIIDDQLELPIYNFNEFKDMTANKLKEWFISFLPSVTDSINWKARLKGSLGDRAITILDEDLMNETLAKIDKLSKTHQGLQLVQDLNTHIKSEQSFTKKEIERLQSTIQSLIHYDEELPSSTVEVQRAIDGYMELLAQLASYESKLAQTESIRLKLAALTKVDLNTDAKDVEDIEAFVEARNAVDNLRKESIAAADEKDDIDKQISECMSQQRELDKIKDSTCPYTFAKCTAIQELVDENKEKLSLLQLTIDQLDKKKDAVYTKMKVVNEKLFAAKNLRDELQSQYTSFFQLRTMLNSVDIGNRPTDLTKDQINAEIKKLQESLSKIEANKQYNELIETITKDKFKATNNLEVLKIWEKFTGANGLQTELMTAPFKSLEEDMGRYLSVMFGQPIEAHFNLIGKANSFSFGVIRQGNYIEFDYLSSGERCLFMLAMMICILDKSQNSLRTILVDDLIDHLDDENAENIYDALTNVADVQFILAGVKSCDAEGVIYI